MQLKILLVCVLLVFSVQASVRSKVDKEAQVLKGVVKDLSCWGCRGGIELIRFFFLNDYFVEFGAYLFTKGCSLFVFDHDQCHITVEAYKQMFVDGLETKTFDPNFFCEITVPVCENKHFKVRSYEADVERILSDKPDIIKDNNYINGLYAQIAEDKAAGNERETMVMYHFSDLHWDLEYKAGTSNVCDQIVCCRAESGEPKTPEQAAGKWGDYNCDANPELFDQIKYVPELTGRPDFVVWTGDNVQHTIDKDPHETTRSTIKITEFVEEHSPDTVVFPIHGNHEFSPMNTENMTLAKDPVIEIVSQAWQHWFTPEVLKEYKENSYFSYDAVTHPDTTEEFKRKMQGTRIISLNTQNCYFFNFYLIGEYNDPHQEFEWLENLLREMEKNGEIGIIIGHMSPGVPDCLDTVSSRLRILQDRFQHIIRLNLFGHTHMEEIEVVRAIEDGKPINVNWLAPSITTYTGLNPSFRVITLDVETKLPVKMATYSVDLAAANKDDSKAFFVLNHEFTYEYGLKDLSPSSVYGLTQEFKTNEGLAVQYIINKSGRGPFGYKAAKGGCNTSCRRKLSCYTSTSTFLQTRACYTFWDSIFDSDVISSVIFEFIYGVWVDVQNA